MRPVFQSNVRNRLLQSLSPEGFALVEHELEPIDLPQGLVIAGPHLPSGYVFFPDHGIASVVTTASEGIESEASLYGREGLGPLAVVLGAGQAQCLNVMRVAGSGHRIAAGPLVAAMDGSPAVRKLLLLYTYTVMTQTAFTALSSAVDSVEQRLARWLLMFHDRCDQDEMTLTHHAIAVMLAVRRASVTHALHLLEYRTLIKAERGTVIMRDRQGMEAFAGPGYGRPEAEYRRLIGSMR